MSENIVKINNREYKILQVLPRRHKEYDLFLCLDLKTKTKECFQRIDVEKEYLLIETPYPQEYKDIVVAEFWKGKRNIEIAKLLYKREDNVRPLKSLNSFVARITTKLKGGRHEKFKS